MPDDISTLDAGNALHFDRILIVEDDVRLSSTLSSLLVLYADEVRACTSMRDALAQMTGWTPDVILLDFKLPDGHATELLQKISQRSPFPAVIALSAYAQPADTFTLAHLGVRAYLQKPFDVSDIESALQNIRFGEPDLCPHIRSSVGSVGLKQLENRVRKVMLEEALSRTDGSRRGAARLLQVSRQFVQHVLNKLRD